MEHCETIGCRATDGAGLSSVLSDGRWRGPHGIGRFATEILARLPEHMQLSEGPRPLSVVDPLWISYQIRSRRPAAYFSPGFNPPLSCPVPTVITLHDLTHVQMPFLATPVRRLYYQALLRPSVRRSYRVLTVSEFSRRAILEWSGLKEESVVNVGNGVSHQFRPDGPRYQPSLRYILYVGCAKPHKNLHRLLDAFKLMSSDDVHLLLTGHATEQLAARLRDEPIGKRIRFLGVVPERLLPYLYRGAALVVLPSLMEGFGLPAIEAMACGTPVVASRAGSLPEVVGDAGVLVDPLDTVSISRGMEWVLENSLLRATLRTAGLQRARSFSWKAVAAKVEAVLREAINWC